MNRSVENQLQSTTSPSIEWFFFHPGDRHGAIAVAPLPDTPGRVEFLTAQPEHGPTWSSVTP